MIGHTPDNQPTPQLAPAIWGESLSGQPMLDREVRGLVPALVRRWRDIVPDIDQAALDHHYISVHLGGPKTLSRRGDGAALVRSVPNGAHSVVPAGAAFRWETRGPIDFMHIYLAPRTLSDVVTQAFDRDPAYVAFEPGLGSNDPLIRSLGVALLDELTHGEQQQAYIDDLMHLIVCRALRLHSNARSSAVAAQHALPPFRLRRAVEFIDANLAATIGVADIANASGVSIFHFSRAFREATGRSPYAYLLERRIETAKTILLIEDGPLGDIAARCGFASANQFSRMFKRETGLPPAAFRRQR